MWNLDEGEISDIVDTPVGFHIFRLDNHIEPSQLAFDEAKRELARRLQKLGSEALLMEHFESCSTKAARPTIPRRWPSAEVVDPATVLFELDDHLITMADIDKQQRPSTNCAQTPPMNGSKASLAIGCSSGKPNRLGLEKTPTSEGSRIEAVEREAMIRIATENRVDALIAELDADGDRRLSSSASNRQASPNEDRTEPL